jgi:hypothetical protein
MKFLKGDYLEEKKEEEKKVEKTEEEIEKERKMKREMDKVKNLDLKLAKSTKLYRDLKNSRSNNYEIEEVK